MKSLLKKFKALLPKTDAQHLADIKREVEGINLALGCGRIDDARMRGIHLAAALDEIELQRGGGV